MPNRTLSALAAELRTDEVPAALVEGLLYPGVPNPDLDSTHLARDVVEAIAGWIEDNALRNHSEGQSFTAAHLRILYVLGELGSATDTQLARRWAPHVARRSSDAWPTISDSGIRSRRAELVRWGLVEKTGAWGKTLNGGPSRIWQPVSLERDVVDADPVPGFDQHALDVLSLLIDEAGTDLSILSVLHHANRAAGQR